MNKEPIIKLNIPEKFFFGLCKVLIYKKTKKIHLFDGELTLLELENIVNSIVLLRESKVISINESHSLQKGHVDSISVNIGLSHGTIGQLKKIIEQFN